MRSLSGLLFLVMSVSPLFGQAAAGAMPKYLVTDDDPPVRVGVNGATLFSIASNGTPQNPNRVSTGGSGAGGGYFNSNRVSILRNSKDSCAFVSISGAGAIAVVDLISQQDIGDFSGSSTDVGIDNGVGLANNGSYLYASYSNSNTIATFAILHGCSLNFLGDISPIGLHGGNVKGMAAHGNLVVVTYGDGSIESFNISAGIPVSNHDRQNATGYASSRYPTGVDITQDGRFAIFGDQASTATVEVSDISCGRLKKTVLYNVGAGSDSASIFLSPDERLLYVANTGNGKVTAAFFDAKTGRVTPGCTSATLKGFDTNWVFISSPVTELNTGTGSVLYLAEFGSISGVAVLDISVGVGKCALTESKESPVADPNSTNLLSIGVYPPRSF